MKRLILAALLTPSLLFAQALEFEGELVIRDYMLSMPNTTPIMPVTSVSLEGFKDIYAHACIVGGVRGSCHLRYMGIIDTEIPDLSIQNRDYYQLDFYQPIDLFSGEVSYVWDTSEVMEAVYVEYLSHYTARCRWRFEQQELFGIFIKIQDGPCPDSVSVPEKTAPGLEPVPFTPIVTGQ